MKKFVLTSIAVVAFSASVFAQGGTQITIDNLNGTGGRTATNNGLFVLNTGAPYTGANINVQLLGGPVGGSLSAIATLSGANALIYSGVPGVYLDQTFATYNVPGVTAGSPASLQILAWTGSANSYANAAINNKFYPWSGSAEVAGNTFTFTQATGGGGAPPGPPKSLDGMPAMVLQVPEPSAMALAGLGAAALMIFRRRK
jgi:hypothetical protein